MAEQNPTTEINKKAGLLGKELDNCNLCGMCNLACPVYQVLRRETGSARNKAWLAKNQEYKGGFYLCTQCGSCINNCPADVQIDCRAIRREIVKQGKETKANQEMKENIQQHGNPFGKPSKKMKINRYYT